jgi:hypothetical protein
METLLNHLNYTNLFFKNRHAKFSSQPSLLHASRHFFSVIATGQSIISFPKSIITSITSEMDGLQMFIFLQSFHQTVCVHKAGTKGGKNSV